MEILVLQIGAAPELLLSTAVIRCLKKQLDVKLHVLVAPENHHLVAHNPYLDFVHAHGKDKISALKQVSFDFIIDLQNNSLSGSIRKLFGVKTVTFMRYPVHEFFAKTFGWNITGSHLIERYFEAVAHLHVYDDGGGSEFFIGQSDVIKIHKDIPTSHQAGFIVISLNTLAGKGHKVFKIVQDYCRAVNYPVILVGGRDNYTLAERVASTAPGNVYNACVKFTSGEGVDIVKHAKVVVALPGDIMVHIGAALKKKMIIVGSKRFVETLPFYGSKFLARNPQPYTFFPGSDVTQLVELTNRFLKPD